MERALKKRYVAGFLFSGEEVLLVRKERPDWQKGLLNGIGGKIEHGETSLEAMVRECREETGLVVPKANWNFFCRETGRDYNTDFYAVRVEGRPQVPSENDSGEVQGWIRLEQLPGMRQVGNLRWLVPMALDWRRIEGAVSARRADIVENPSW